jgi:thymidylate synthase ThyX
MEITARVIAHSNLRAAHSDTQYTGEPLGDFQELVTFELEYPRMIHAQMMTYSFEVARNTQSSRAVPVQRMIDLCLNSGVEPVRFGQNQRGMQDKGEDYELTKARRIWEEARSDAMMHAFRMNKLGIHKQVCNRIIEPFMPVRAIFTFSGRSLRNVLRERLSHDADPTIYALAVAMRDAYNDSSPVFAVHHIPYIDELKGIPLMERLVVSAAACARVSYRRENFDVDAAKALVRRLLEDGHGSPLEHVVYQTKKKPLGRFQGVTTLREMREALEVMLD